MSKGWGKKSEIVETLGRGVDKVLNPSSGKGRSEGRDLKGK